MRSGLLSWLFHPNAVQSIFAVSEQFIKNKEHVFMSIAPDKHHNLGYFNLARGLGMILILAGHSFVPFLHISPVSGSPAPFSGAGSVLGAGVMAMFFLISGFGFYTRSPRKCLSTQNKLLLFPYYQVALILIAVRLVLTFLRGRNILQTAADLLLTYPLGLNAENSSALFGEPVKSVTILWFILALYGGWVIYNAICRIKDQRRQRLLVLGCVVVSWALTLISKAWPMCLPMALLACGYLDAGHTIKQKNLLFQPLSWKAWAAMAAVITISSAFGYVDIGAGIWKMGLIDVASTFCIGFILLRAYSRFMQLELRHPLIHILERIGNRSVWIVFLHAMEKSVLPWYRLQSLLPDASILCALICLIARSLLIWAAYRIFTRLQRILRTKKKARVRIDP